MTRKEFENQAGLKKMECKRCITCDYLEYDREIESMICDKMQKLGVKNSKIPHEYITACSYFKAAVYAAEKGKEKRIKVQ